jgi:Pentapeptide repeats (8 copies)
VTTGDARVASVYCSSRNASAGPCWWLNNKQKPGDGHNCAPNWAWTVRRKLIDASRAELTGARLDDADLTQANLHGATLCPASFVDATMTATDLRDADIKGADFRGAIGVKLPDGSR